MHASRSPFGTPPGRGGFGGSPNFSAPPDLVVLLVVIFVTLTMQFFKFTAIIPALLQMTPLVYRGAIWQLVTYPFVGFGAPNLWFLVELIILFWFGRDIFWRLGRRRFWQLIVWTALAASVSAAIVQLVGSLLFSLAPLGGPFFLIQGQHMLTVILVAAFATMSGEATILLFFVLPIKARWFLWLEILFAFFGYLNTKDLGGFVGVCVAVAVTYSTLAPGGLRRGWTSWRLRLRRLMMERRLAKLRQNRRFDVIENDPDEKKPDKWVH